MSEESCSSCRGPIDPGQIVDYIGRFIRHRSREDCFAAKESRIAALEAENQRLMDIARAARHFLFDDGLVSAQEFAALVADSDSGQRVARIEAYDKLHDRNEKLSAEVARLTRERDEARADSERLDWLEKTVVNQSIYHGRDVFAMHDDDDGLWLSTVDRRERGPHFAMDHKEHSKTIREALDAARKAGR